MKTKRKLSRRICWLIGFVIVVGVIRITTYQTLVNQEWHANSQLKYKFFNKVQEFINEELASLSQNHFIPVDVLYDLVSIEEVRTSSQHQTAALLAYNRGESDHFPIFNVDDLMAEFDERMSEYARLNPSTSCSLIPSLRHKTEKLLMKNLRIINYTEYQENSVNKYLGYVMIFFSIPYFYLLFGSITLGLASWLAIVWKGRIIEWFYYFSAAILGSGGFLFGVFLRVHHIGYYEKNKNISELRNQLYQLNFNEYFKIMYTIGMHLMMIGFIVFLVTILIKELYRISTGEFFDDASC